MTFLDTWLRDNLVGKEIRVSLLQQGIRAPIEIRGELEWVGEDALCVLDRGRSTLVYKHAVAWIREVVLPAE